MPETASAYDYFGQIVGTDGTVLSTRVRCSRASLVDKSLLCQARQLLFFRVDNLTQACPGGARSSADQKEEPHLNPNAGTSWFSLPNLDGYYVGISALEAA